MTISLFKAWVYGQKDYIQRLIEVSTDVETYLNQIFGQITGPLSQMAVPSGLQEIFDRLGLIGDGSYDFAEGALSSPSYNLTIQPGAYWNNGIFYHKITTTILSMAGKSNGTYYVNLDAAGTPLISSSTDATTTRSFSWNGSTVSSKTLYAGVSILFDGTDYADCLDSTARSKTFTRLATRLEELEALVAEMGAFYALDHISGLDVYYQAGKCRDAESQVHDTAAGHVACTDNATNYIEVASATGVVSVNQAGFTTGSIPLFLAVAASGVITLTDKRTWACVGGGTGGGHTQGTDLGTTSSQFEIDTDATGAPTGRAGIRVNNGSNPFADIKFNRDTEDWEYTVDGGVTWKVLGEVDMDLGGQELHKTVFIDDPPKVLDDNARGSSPDYEELDLSSYITDAPDGVAGVVLRVRFWDSAPGLAVNAMFRRKGAIGAPAQAFTFWGSELDPGVIMIGVDSTPAVEFFVNASGADTANLQVHLLGYFKIVQGTGSQKVSFPTSGLSVLHGATTLFNITGFFKRGMAYSIKVEETGGLVTGLYDIGVYSKDTCGGAGGPALTDADKLYIALGINPAADSRIYEDPMAGWRLEDEDDTNELHLKIKNNDGSQSGTYIVTIVAERFA